MTYHEMNVLMASRQDILCHHGIKGQRWGVENGPPYPLSKSKHDAVIKIHKKYQNPDGTLTEAGKKRYYSDYSTFTLNKRGVKDSNKKNSVVKNDPILKKHNEQVEKQKQETAKKEKEAVAFFKNSLSDKKIDFSKFDYKVLKQPDTEEYKRYMKIVELGARALNKIRGQSYIEDAHDINEASWFLFEDQTIGYPELARLVNDGNSKEKVKSIVNAAQYISLHPDNSTTYDSDVYDKIVNFAYSFKAGFIDEKDVDMMFEAKDEMDGDKKTIKHHGIKGQRWGVENGPPYPLNKQTHLAVIKGKIKEHKQKKDEKTKRKIAESMDIEKIYKHRKLFTNEELENAVKRAQQEERVRKEARNEKLRKRESLDAFEAKIGIGQGAKKESLKNEGDIKKILKNSRLFTDDEMNELVNRLGNEKKVRDLLPKKDTYKTLETIVKYGELGVRALKAYNQTSEETHWFDKVKDIVDSKKTNLLGDENNSKSDNKSENKNNSKSDNKQTVNNQNQKKLDKNFPTDDETKMPLNDYIEKKWYEAAKERGASPVQAERIATSFADYTKSNAKLYTDFYTKDSSAVSDDIDRLLDRYFK